MTSSKRAEGRREECVHCSTARFVHSLWSVDKFRHGVPSRLIVVYFYAHIITIDAITIARVCFRWRQKIGIALSPQGHHTLSPDGGYSSSDTLSPYYYLLHCLGDRGATFLGGQQINNSSQLVYYSQCFHFLNVFSICKCQFWPLPKCS